MGGSVTEGADSCSQIALHEQDRNRVHEVLAAPILTLRISGVRRVEADTG